MRRTIKRVGSRHNSVAHVTPSMIRGCLAPWSTEKTVPIRIIRIIRTFQLFSEEHTRHFPPAGVGGVGGVGV